MGSSRENIPGSEELGFIYLFWLDLFPLFRQSEIISIKRIQKLVNCLTNHFRVVQGDSGLVRSRAQRQF